jgi:hypothetical protein
MGYVVTGWSATIGYGVSLTTTFTDDRQYVPQPCRVCGGTGRIPMQTATAVNEDGSLIVVEVPHE